METKNTRENTPVILDAVARHEMEDQDSVTIFGFWVYLMTDFVMFACLFATFAVLHNNTFGGPSAKEIFSLPFVLVETFVLLTSSFTCGLGMLAAHHQKKKELFFWFIVTFLLGVVFLVMELTEFRGLIHEGNSFTRSGFLSSYFALVGTHGLHVFIGLCWMVVLLVQVLRRSFTRHVTRRLILFSIFWHFLDLIWIFIFTIVYLLSAL
ncbi:MAG TPA: cytochrome o ubiquinol oxidase subunit III [Candidatus Paceibacterota bacterium]|nr:cytochrome o ubiquinol oxidase subunit III [Candidatus Paceibacterota bacterium]